MHVCDRNSEIVRLQIDMEVCKSDIVQAKENIRDIKSAIEKGNEKIITLLYWLMGVMGTTVLSFLGFLITKGAK